VISIFDIKSLLFTSLTVKSCLGSNFWIHAELFPLLNSSLWYWRCILQGTRSLLVCFHFWDYSTILYFTAFTKARQILFGHHYFESFRVCMLRSKTICTCALKRQASKIWALQELNDLANNAFLPLGFSCYIRCGG